MRPSSWRILCAAAACGAGLMSGREAAAQSLGGSASPPSVAPSPAVQALSVTPLYGPQIPNGAADDAAALSGVSGQRNIFSNPLAAPLLYPSMAGPMWAQNQAAAAASSTSATSTATSSTATSSAATAAGSMSSLGQGMAMNQLGMFMLLSNQQNGGVGSGRLSGARGTQRTTKSPGSPTPTEGRMRPSDRPGGLAARYFNRTAARPTYPQRFFNRRPSYFP